MAETTREAILEALRDLLASPMAEEFFPPASIDEPDPSAWREIPGTSPRLKDACAIQDGPPPERLAYVRGGDDQNSEELELEAVIAYAVQALPDGGQTAEDCRTARRARRDAAVRRISRLIAANRRLDMGLAGELAEVFAEVLPAQRDDAVAFPNAEPGAVALVPVRVLYTAVSAAD